MNRLLRTLICIVPILTFVGCGGPINEEAPPTEAPTMTDEEQKDMEDEMKKMRENYKM